MLTDVLVLQIAENVSCCHLPTPAPLIPGHVTRVGNKEGCLVTLTEWRIWRCMF